MSKITIGQAPSTLIPKYIGSEFDHVVTVGMNIESVKKVAMLDQEDLTTVADNIEEIVVVGDNIEYVVDVAEGLHGMPVTTFTGPNPPTVTPIPEGSNWFCTENGRTYIYYVDLDSGQWVESTPQSGFPTEIEGIYDGIRDGVVTTAPSENAVFDALALKAPLGHTHPWEDVSGKPATFPPSAHSHTPSEAGAAPAVHGHTIADVSGLQGALDGKVSKSGDVMVGKLTLPNLQTDAFLAFQEVNQLGTVLSSNSAGYTEIVRQTASGPEWGTGIRAYGGADWRIGAEPIITAAGGTLTGPLKLSSTGTDEERIVGLTDGNPSWFVGKEAGDADVVLYSYDHGNYLTIKADSIQFAKDPVSNAAQGTGGASLTRKDYVDNTFVKKSGDTIDGTLNLVGGGGNKNVRLNYESIGYYNGDILRFYPYYEVSDDSYRISRYDSAGNYIGLAFQAFPSGATNISDPHSMSPQGTGVGSLTRKDYVDTTLLEVREALQAEIATLRAELAEMRTLMINNSLPL